jgi:hypothetical protein
MMNSRIVVESLSSSDLRSATHELVRTSCGVDAAILVHLGEIDERKLYLDWRFSSMFAFCVGELGFSEDIACNRIDLARAARRLPVILDALSSGRVHMAGLRLLAPHLTTENQEKVLAEAAGKSKRQIEELVARLWSQPPVPTIVRKLPDRSAPPPEASCGFSFGAAVPNAQAELAPAPAFAAPPSAPTWRDERPSKVSPLSEDAFKFQFTASRACHEKLRQAQDLLRHRVPNGDVATIFEKALDVLIDQVKKERFATGRRRDRIGPRTHLNRLRVTSRTRSSARSSNATAAAARSPTRRAVNAARRAAWNSITSTASLERVSTEQIGSACSAEATINTPRRRCTVPCS